MKEASEYFNRFQNNLLGGINTCLIGQIESYDPIVNKADIILLPDGDLVMGVPIGAIQTSDFFIRVPYKPGDYVLVIFSQRDIDGITQGEDATPTDRMLSVDDAIGAIGLNMFDDPLPAEDTDKLIISHKDKNVNGLRGKITMSKDGHIEIYGPEGVTITGKTGGVTY